jgi:hypothetical protein
MKKFPLLLKLLPCLCIGAISFNSEAAKAASLLTFDGLRLDDFANIPGSYGDNLPDTSNIQIEYRTLDAISGVTLADNLSFWSTGYGDLENVAFPTSNGYLGEIALIAQAGYSVTLNSFDLAGWPLSDQLAQTVRILDGNFNILANYSPVNVEGDSGRTSFSPNLTQSGTIRIQFGPSWNTGIDNIGFSQGTAAAVPTPALLPGLIGLGLGAWRRRKAETESQNLDQV